MRRCSQQFLLFLIALFINYHNAFASEIDFQSMPKCAIESCLPFHASSIGCIKFTKHCFCNALAPVNCSGSKCTDNDWYAVEDWYSTQCPGEPPLVTLDPGIPLGARKCIREQIVPNQCKASITRNCFCRLDNVTAEIGECITDNTGATRQQAVDLAADFYRDTCVLREDATGEVRPGTTTEEEVVAPPHPSSQSPTENPKAQDLGLIVGLVASFITIAGLFTGCCCYKKNKKRRGQETTNDDSPPPYSK
ncbi:hypothetical protein IQ06DRAFT_372622 [Phaeosphaeriaceae sp. SRC1lsM3a]|nr:hypothetical protein IQ06DRAFT_372622 [Stagonospora sp. SRC1lsM3a]